ncbi:UDP-glucose dehydrogenase family protein [Streptomyces goshikiensis]
MAKRRIVVFGAGYIGLVTGACLAEVGHHVTVRDINPERVRVLRTGDVPIHEPGLGDMIARNKERLAFTEDLAEAVTGAEIAYVCVDTPPSASGDADLSRVWSVVRSLSDARDLKAVVMKSTVPVGTGARARALLDELGMADVGYVSNPEFTAEGRAIQDFMDPDRIVIGHDNDTAGALVAALHTGITAPVATMDVRSAEMVKLAANALLATKISFANEIATLCENTGANVTDVLGAVGMDHRLGAHFLRPGIGWGGSCFPKDSEALRQMASNTGFHPPLLTAVINVNNIQKRRAVQNLKDKLGDLADKHVALLGMAFKPGTDDMREAPSTILASRLLAEGAHVRSWDPLARPAAGEPWDSVARFATPQQALAGADAVVIVTEWPELAEVDWTEAHGLMRTPVMFDGRNLLDPTRLREIGFRYTSVGRP